MRNRQETRMRAGIVLVLVSSVLVLLFFLSTALLALARANAAWSGSALASAGAELAAASGTEYAAARLGRAGYPLYSTDPSRKGDEWLFGDPPGTPVERSLNVSFAHGEGWIDDGDGKFSPGEPWLDADRDGRFTPFSGRLRGGGPRSERFSLKIESQTAKLPVNGGYLDDGNRDLDGTWPNIEHPGVVDHRDPNIGYHRGLVHALNNLGAILFPPGTFRTAEVPAGDPATLDGDPIRTCWIGHDLIHLRPEGGYPDLAAVGQALLAEGYSQAQVGTFLPYLDVGSYDLARLDGKAYWNDTRNWSIPYSPVSLAGASKEVLTALWMYLRCPVHQPPGPFDDLPPGPPYHNEPWRYFRYTRSGAANLTFEQTDGSGQLDGYNEPLGMLPTIFPDEAERIADLAHQLRKDGQYDWIEFRKRLAQEAPNLFAQDFADLDANADGDNEPSTNPLGNQRSWVRAKADLAFSAVCEDPHPWNPVQAVHVGWGEKLDYEPGLQGAQVYGALLPHMMGHVPYPEVPYSTSYDPVPPIDPELTNAPYRIRRTPDSASRPWPDFGTGLHLSCPQGLSLEPPARFSVESLGRGPSACVRLKGEIQTAERLDFVSQEDFEALEGTPPFLAGHGIRLTEGPRRPALTDAASGRTYPHVQSYPVYNASRDPATCYSYSRGGIGLAPRQIGRRDAWLYQTFPEDLDGNVSNDFYPESGQVQTQYGLSSCAESGSRASGTWGFTSYNDRGQKLVLQDESTFLTVPASTSPAEYVQQGTLEAWILPMSLREEHDDVSRYNDSLGIDGSVSKPSGGSYNAQIGIRTEHRPGGGLKFEVRMNWSSPAEWVSKTAYFLDWDPDTGIDTRSARSHVALVFRRNGAGDQSHFKFYINGELWEEWDYPSVPNPEHMRKFYKWLWQKHEMADEIRIHSVALEEYRILEHYTLGCCAAPVQGPAADPLANPVNPTYLSPVYDLGAGAFRKVRWLGLTTPELDGLVRARLIVYALDENGNALGQQAVADPNRWADLGLPTARKLRYVLEWHRAPLASVPLPPLLDSPLVEAVHFTLQRPGVGPAWLKWTRR